MGSRASTLLRDEELEEIKKETGCELGQGGGNAAGRLRLASGRPGADVAEVWGWGVRGLRGSRAASGTELRARELENLLVQPRLPGRGSGSWGTVLRLQGGSRDYSGNTDTARFPAPC